MNAGWQWKVGLVCLTAASAFLGVFAFAYLHFWAAPHAVHPAQIVLIKQSAFTAVKYGSLLTPIMAALIIFRIEARKQAKA